MSYWLGVHTEKAWSDPRRDGSRIAWPAELARTVSRIKPGDRIITYVTHLQRFHAAYEVTGPLFRDCNYYLAGRPFRECVPVRELAVQRARDGVALSEIRDDLELFKKLRDPKGWSGVVRRSIRPLDDIDGETILRALQGSH